MTPISTVNETRVVIILKHISFFVSFVFSLMAAMILKRKDAIFMNIVFAFTIFIFNRFLNSSDVTLIERLVKSKVCGKLHNEVYQDNRTEQQQRKHNATHTRFYAL